MAGIETKLYGTNYGGFHLPTDLQNYINKDSVIYMFGVGLDISLDCILSGIIQNNVYLFDPTPKSVVHHKLVQNILDGHTSVENNVEYGGGQSNYWDIILKSKCKSEHLNYYDYGLFTENTKIKFYKPTNPNYVSHSILSEGRSNEYIEVDVKRLDTIMKELNHTHIDFLKVDIENVETPVLNQMLDLKICLPRILCVDFDSMRTNNSQLINNSNLLIRKLENIGYIILKNDNYDITFLYYPTVYLPKQPRKDMHNHSNDTFRELVHLWGNKKLCKVVLTDGPLVTWNKDVLLYDRPILSYLQNAQYKLGLFGNPPPPQNSGDKRNVPWIFWGRRPVLLEAKLLKLNSKLLKYNERSIESIFLGKIENNIQEHYRNVKNQNWSKVIELYHMANYGEKYKYNQSEYLDLISKSKYGLCLRGFGPKCNREIELLAFGTVLLVTPDVDVANYHEPLKENVHFIRVNNPNEIKNKIKHISEKEWSRMSNECYQWYLRNCSIYGSFNTTKKIVFNFK